MRRLASTALSIAFVCLGAACRQGSGENLGLFANDHRAADPARLGEPAGAMAALALDAAAIDAALGARRLTVSTTIVTTTSAGKEALAEAVTLDTDGRGAFHLIHDTDRKDGMEAIFAGGALYVRPRYGTFVRREPLEGERERLRAHAERVAHDYLDAVYERFAIDQPASHGDGGRQALRAVVKRAAEANPARERVVPRLAWRDELDVRELDGHLLFDPKTGAWLGGELKATYSFKRETETAPVVVALTLSARTTAAEPITAPADAITSLKRPRPLVERQQLLEGL